MKVKNLLLFTAQFVNPCLQIFPFTFNWCVLDFQIQSHKEKNVGVYKSREKMTKQKQKKISRALEKFLELKLEAWVLHKIGQDSSKYWRTTFLHKFTFQEFLSYGQSHKEEVFPLCN